MANGKSDAAREAAARLGVPFYSSDAALAAFENATAIYVKSRLGDKSLEDVARLLLSDDEVARMDRIVRRGFCGTSQVGEV